MVQIRESRQAAGSRTPRSSPVACFAMAVAAAVFVSLALAAAKSGGFYRCCQRTNHSSPISRPDARALQELRRIFPTGNGCVDAVAARRATSGCLRSFMAS